MAAIEKDRVLRINCPGYGHQSYFSTGCARALEDYSVIVVNPISVLHLFDKDPDLLRQIESAQSDGMTAFVAKSDKLVQSVVGDLEGRKDELAVFLEEGGLLVYFLCPPFTVQGPNEQLDNYSWLDVLAPDKPQGKTDRHMSSASRGKNIELTEQGKLSPFSAYLRQAGLEWSTIIRAENLTEGYVPLATAGPNKCISAEFDVGDKGGHIVFLPAPYLPEFDAALMESIQAWWAERPEQPAKAKPARPRASEALAPPPEPVPQMTIEPELAEPPAPAAEQPTEAAAPAEEQEPLPTYEAPASEADYEQAEPEYKEPEPEYKEPEAEYKEPEAEYKEPEPEYKEPEPEPERHAPEPARYEPPPVRSQAAPEAPYKAKDLMEKMEEISKTTVPEWCREYSFSDLDQLREQLLELNEQVRLTQMKISEVEGRIQTMEWLKNALLSSEGEDLMRACTRVFEHLGWTVNPADANKNELYLVEAGKAVAIARVVRTATQVKRSDLAQLAESVITYWGEHEEEPKGVLVASTWANRPPSERSEPDYTDALAEFAEKKHLCLMTTMQLLCIFRDIEGGYASAEDLRDSILSTSGRLEGYVLEPGLATTVP